MVKHECIRGATFLFSACRSVLLADVLASEIRILGHMGGCDDCDRCEDYGSGILYDRHFDFPTGAGLFVVDIPVWALDAVFFVGTAVAFGFYARSKLQEQKV